MGKFIADNFVVPIETHACSATTQNEIVALLDFVDEGDYIRYNTRQIPVEVIEARDTSIVVRGDSGVYTIEKYNGRKYSVRACFGESTTPVTAFAIVGDRGSEENGYSVSMIRECARAGVLWRVAYDELDEDGEVQTVEMLATQLRYEGECVVSLHNHITGGNPVYTTVDTFSDVAVVVDRDCIVSENAVSVGDSIRIVGQNTVGGEMCVCGDVMWVDSVASTYQVGVLTDDRRYCVSVCESGVLLHDEIGVGESVITHVVCELSLI